MQWRWIYFARRELVCRHCGGLVIVPDFLDRLDTLRHAYGRPLIVTSGYRCPEHNARVSSTGRTGPHTTGRAVDLRLHGTDAHRLIGLVVTHGFTGVGVKQHGPHTGRFLHLDDLPNGATGPRPWIWSYP